MEEDSVALYQEDGLPYYEVELHPDDGFYLLPYVARRSDGSPEGTPFEEGDLEDQNIDFGGRQSFYPDASRIFEEIDRTIVGRDASGRANVLDRKADFDFFRPLPSAGYISRGEERGRDFYAYQPFALSKSRPRREDLARVTNGVLSVLRSGDYAGGIWLECSSTIEESLYWLNLLADTELPIAGCAAQRPHGQLSNDGDRNIVDAVDYVLSGAGKGIGVVGIQDEQIFAARDFKKGDDRPGGYKVTGGHGGVLGTVGPPVTIWYRPDYRHTIDSQMGLGSLPETAEFREYADDSAMVRLRVKDEDGFLIGEAIPRVNIIKYGAFMDEGDALEPGIEVDIMARIAQSNLDQTEGNRVLQGLVLEGDSPYAMGTAGQSLALEIAAFSGMPVVRVGRSDPGGLVPEFWRDHTIRGNNLDANKARILLMASMLKLGALPRARDPHNPSPKERRTLLEKVEEFQDIFEQH